MKIECFGCDYSFDLQALALLFFPNTKFAGNDDDGRTLRVDFNGSTATAFFSGDGVCGSGTAQVNPILYDAEKAACKAAAFTVLNNLTGIRPAWGLLTGIRPAVFYEKIVSKHGNDADNVMLGDYLVLPEKLQLCHDVCKNRRAAVESVTSKDVCLYISVPFCPSRCKYCSFVSCTTDKEHKIIPAYLDKLCEELGRKAQQIDAAGQKVRAVYIGGGTPTVLTAEQLDRLCGCVVSLFDMSGVKEFTVEAGRPDTITPQKLDVMLRHGVGRISVNPQTLNDDILRLVGRNHTAQQFFSAYDEAKKRGFSVNVDLIAGLPTETAEGFLAGLRQVLDLRPENITVHTLYIKRAADYGLARGAGLDGREHAAEVGKMVSGARQMCARAGLEAYYMYRQKNTVGNNENVGYAAAGQQCLYNIWMMDDVLTVYGCGAGAMTKYVSAAAEGVNICRIANTKFAYNYIKQTEDGNTKADAAV